MRIEHYRFGLVVVGGKTFRSDVIVTPWGVRAPWRRKTGHLLRPDDLDDITPPGTLVIGTGAVGAMAVPPETRRALEVRGFRVEVAPTPEAVERYNRRLGRGPVFAALHVTC